ncbi:hypothetical protein [Curtobacterium sp. S6]|uniref:hypothetical protein n=1 Tax=Curtobacterium sp. S6 TaxID=1479623 RepID=UPI00128F31D1|nr:hypothetical protein [Curtobacterium sp. S6]
MGRTKYIFLPVATVVLALAPWSDWSTEMVYGKLAAWIEAVILSQILLFGLRKTKVEPFIIFIIIFSVFVYSIFGFNARGQTTNFAYMMGICASMHVYSLVTGGPEKSRRTNRSKNSVGGSVVDKSRKPVPAEIIELDGISVTNSPGQEKRAVHVKFSLGSRERMPAGFRSTVFMDSDVLNCNFEVKEFDEEFIHSGKIVDDNGRMSNQVFALIFNRSFHGGTDVDKIFGSISNGKLVVYSPENNGVLGVTFDEGGTNEFVQWIEQFHCNWKS